MGMLSTLFSKIFPSDHPAIAAVQTPSPSPSAASTPPAAASTAAAPAVDVQKVLSDMAAKNPEKLNWQTSIVDLMKLVGMDSSMAARKSLAAELHYTGDTNDSAAMNMWLQKQVVSKIAANGGKLPPNMTA